MLWSRQCSTQLTLQVQFLLSFPCCAMTSFGQCRKQWKCRRCSSYGVVDVLCDHAETSFRFSRQVVDVPVVQVVVGASGATGHGGNHRSDSAVEQIVASRAADHGEFVMVRWCRRCSSCGYGRLCDHAVTWVLTSGSISDSAYRQSQWTFQFNRDGYTQCELCSFQGWRSWWLWRR